MERATRVGLVPDFYYAYRQGRPGQDMDARDERLFVHFDIFKSLKNGLRGDLLSERKFSEVQHYTHRLGLKRINPTFVFHTFLEWYVKPDFGRPFEQCSEYGANQFPAVHSTCRATVSAIEHRRPKTRIRHKHRGS